MISSIANGSSTSGLFSSCLGEFGNGSNAPLSLSIGSIKTRLPPYSITAVAFLICLIFMLNPPISYVCHCDNMHTLPTSCQIIFLWISILKQLFQCPLPRIITQHLARPCVSHNTAINANCFTSNK
ncbi:Uncharacterised protein [Staphylococcus aureus]|nr:Uncharacterised protein [Staphylococcus aureus]